MSESLDLDNPATYSALDPGHMYHRVGELDRQMEDAWNLAGGVELPPEYQSVRQVVVAGMGGSAIGGSLLESYGSGEIPLPFTVWRNYGVPGFVDENTLVICSSYSGNTEETLSAFRAARNRGAKLLVISTGGTITSLAREAGAPLLSFSYNAQPRATLGYLFTPLVRIFARLGFLGDQEQPFEEALRIVREVSAQWSGERSTSENVAKQIASACHGKVVVVYGAEYLSAVARRWKTQMNENAKNWSFYEEFSELNHNAIVGYEYPEGAHDAVQVVSLRGSHLSERIAIRMRVTGELLDRFKVPWRTVDARGDGKLAQMFSLIALGDYASYYLALLNGADPTTIAPIDFLKDALARASTGV